MKLRFLIYFAFETCTYNVNKWQYLRLYTEPTASQCTNRDHDHNRTGWNEIYFVVASRVTFKYRPEIFDEFTIMQLLRRLRVHNQCASDEHVPRWKFATVASLPLTRILYFYRFKQLYSLLLLMGVLASYMP
jgi:hypothetical protein